MLNHSRNYRIYDRKLNLSPVVLRSGCHSCLLCDLHFAQSPVFRVIFLANTIHLKLDLGNVGFGALPVRLDWRLDYPTLLLGLRCHP